MRYNNENTYYQCRNATQDYSAFIFEGVNDGFASPDIYEQTEAGDGHVETERLCEEQ